jgi:hypothetical protein
MTPTTDGGCFSGPYPAPFARDFDTWRHAVSLEKVAELRTHGWTVIDNFLEGGGHGRSSACNASANANDEDATENDRRGERGGGEYGCNPKPKTLNLEP